MKADPQTAFAVIFRGNTNLPLDQLNAQNITGLMLEMAAISQNQTEYMLQNGKEDVE